MMSRFWVTAQISKKCTEWPQNDLDKFKVKNTNMHVTCTLEAQFFVRFALRRAVFKEIEMFELPIGYNV